MAIELCEMDEFNQGTRIKVIGIGGGGGNAVEHMIRSSVSGVEFICANTDAQALGNSSAVKTIQLGSTGLGAGSKPEKGREAALQAEQEIREAIEGATMLFITAGMGGGTGTGAAPVVARIAREMGILTVAVVTKPFEFEGSRRMKNAQAGLLELEENVDSFIVVLNEKLLEVMGNDVGQDEAFSQANNVLRNAVGGIAEIINVPGHVNVDFQDVSTVMSEPGRAMMGTATASGPDRARIAAESSIQSPLLEGIEISGAKAVLVLISASKASFKLSESKQATETITAYASPDALVIYGTAYDETLGDELRVTVVATGLQLQSADGTAPSKEAPPLLHQFIHTGTDSYPIGISDMLHQLRMNNGHLASDNVSSAMSGSAINAININNGATSPRVTVGAAAGGGTNVWRTNRTQASARVEALSNGGMDDYEIPAYLRKQAD